MKLDDMRTLAAETLKYFIQSMPNMPFNEDGIIFDFVKKSDMSKRALELCAIYCPEKIFTDSQLRQLNESIAANALIGREKSVVLIRINSKSSKIEFRRMIFHELMHIYCGLVEMDGEHFIDIFGTGTTPDVAPEDKTYDGIIVAGYTVWTEFIAQYYAIKMIDTKGHEFSDVQQYINGLFYEVNVLELEKSKGSFSMLCSYWLTCEDFSDTFTALGEGVFMPKNQPHGAETQKALYACIDYLHKQLQKEQPWKISEEFIYQVGYKFSMLRMMNSMLLGILNPKQ